MTIISEIKKKAEEYTSDSAEFLKSIIRHPSTSLNEKSVIERIKQEMEKTGFDEVRIDGLGNILGRIGSGKHVIAMDAHIDVVDAGDLSTWKTKPFEPVEENGIIKGRGASDQKAGMAAMVYAAKIVKELNLLDDFTLWITGTVMEEDCDGLCWQYILKEKIITPECVVITEPTNLNIYRGHRGRMELTVTTKGLSAHGSAPERGKNAVYMMADIIKDIEKLNSNLRNDEFLGKGTVTISDIRSTSPSLCAVADSCTIHLDRRLTAGEDKKTVLEEIQNLDSVKKHSPIIEILQYKEESYTGLTYPTEKYYPTWVLPENHNVLNIAENVYSELFSEKPTIDKWTFSTNGIATMGMFNIPTFGFGPANEIYAHSPEDQVPIEHLTKAMMFYALFPKTYVESMKREEI